MSNPSRFEHSAVSLHWVLPLVLIGGCMGFGGPTTELPDNIGQSHDHERSTRRRQADDEVEPEPVPVGTRVWGNYRDTGFYFFGVVVERDDERHRVIYADGSTEWLTAASLLPDGLSVDATVHVRSGLASEFIEGTTARRLGDAVYLRYPNGDERWNVLAHLRFQPGDVGTPLRSDPAAPAPPGGVAPGSNVLVNYREGGFRFGAVVTAVADDERVHVVYLDGETEWVPPQLVTPDTLSAGDLVHVRRRWEPAEWVRGRVQTRQGHAFHILLDDGGLAWTTLFRIRAPIIAAVEAAPPEGLMVEPESEG